MTSKTTLYIMTGLPYAGKTMLRNVLVKRFDFNVVSLDEIIAERKHKIERMSPADWNSAYQEAYNRLEKLLADGKTAIFDSCNLYRHERDGAKRVAENAGANCKLIYINTPPAEVRKKWLINQQTGERSSLEEDFFDMTIRIFEKPAPEENPVIYSPTEDLDAWIRKHIGEFAHDRDIRGLADRYNKFYPFYHPQKFFVRETIIQKILEKNPDIDLAIKNKIVKGLIFLYGKSFNIKYGENNFLPNWFQDFIAITEGRRLEKIYLRNKKEIKKLSILDAGCGIGYYFNSFSRSGLRYFIDYTGIDIVEKNIIESRRLYPVRDRPADPDRNFVSDGAGGTATTASGRSVSNGVYPGARFEHGDIVKLPFPSASFDVVLASRVLEYVPLENLRTALEELLRVAKKTVIINFFLEKDIPDHIETQFSRCCRNTLSRGKLREFFMARNCAVSITDAYRPFADTKIEYSDRFGNPLSLSSWVIEKPS